MNRERVAYVPLPDTTPESETIKLAVVYRFILDRHTEKKAAGEVGGEEHARKELIDGSRNRTIPQP